MKTAYMLAAMASCALMATASVDLFLRSPSPMLQSEHNKLVLEICPPAGASSRLHRTPQVTQILVTSKDRVDEFGHWTALIPAENVRTVTADRAQRRRGCQVLEASFNGMELQPSHYVVTPLHEGEDLFELPCERESTEFTLLASIEDFEEIDPEVVSQFSQVEEEELMGEEEAENDDVELEDQELQAEGAQEQGAFGRRKFKARRLRRLGKSGMTLCGNAVKGTVRVLSAVGDSITRRFRERS